MEKIKVYISDNARSGRYRSKIINFFTQNNVPIDICRELKKEDIMRLIYQSDQIEDLFKKSVLDRMEEIENWTLMDLVDYIENNPKELLKPIICVSEMGVFGNWDPEEATAMVKHHHYQSL